MPFVSTLQSLSSGPLAWVDTGLVPLGAVALLQKPLLGETLADDETTLSAPLSPLVSRTAVFTATEDCTLRNLIIPFVSRTGDLVLDPSFNTLLGPITVAGTGPDVGSLMDGYGIPGGMFSYANLTEAPQWNVRLAAGDTISLDIYILGGDHLPINLQFTYDRGLDTKVTPTRFVGGATAPGLVATVDGSAPATGTITVDSSPLSDGDTITLFNTAMSNLSLDGGGGTLSGTSGGGASGTSTWDTDVTGVTAIRDAILAALQDSGNPWAETYTFASSGGDSITCTRILSGAAGNTDLFSTTAATGISLTPSTGYLAGGSSTPASSSLASPSLDLTIQRIVLGSFVASFIPTPFVQALPVEFTSMEVNSTPVAVAPVRFPVECTTILGVRVDVPVSSGDTLDMFTRSDLGTSTIFYCLVGVAS